jgi:hypothetical protein
VLAAVSTAGATRGVLRVHPADLPQPTAPPHPSQSAPPPPRLARGPGDLTYLNADPAPPLHGWPYPGAAEGAVRQTREAPRSSRGDDFVTVAFPRIAAGGPGADRAAAGALASYEREVAVVDARLAHQVTLAFKAMALADLCDRLRADTGIQLVAGRSVADEKVILFCKATPLREVMRQLSRPFGYAWLRSGKAGDYHYELVQDLRSQLLEEELRNRDRNEALLALDREMQRYRKYLGLSPDEAMARAKTAPPEEKKLLEHLAVDGWGLVQIYFRLSPHDLAALRAGQSVLYSQEPGPDQQPLPPGLANGVLQSQRNRRIVPYGDGLGLGNTQNEPDGLLPAAVPEARAQLMLEMPQSELGQFTFTGGPGVFIAAGSSRPGYFNVFGGAGALAVGMSPSVLNPNNAAANAKLARDPGLRSRVTVQPNPSCHLVPSPVRWPAWAVVAPVGVVPEPRVTTADVLEALHQTSGMPIVADYYTRLYPPTAVSVRNTSLFDALNQLADTMRLRWQKAGSWLQFRSTGFFNDRLKEVPNRLLARWATSRRQHGELTLDDLIEIAGLSDAQLDASSMAEGARACFGLTEWDLPRLSHVRPHLRFLAEFTPAQRQQAQTLEGLPFPQMTLAQQQGYLARAFLRDGEAHLDDLARATLYVDYSMPSGFRWSPSGREDRPWPVRERTREAALQAARRIDAQAAEERVVPTPLDVTILYMPHPGAGPVHLVNSQNDGFE